MTKMTKLKLSLKFKVNQDGHPKDAEKRSLYDDDFSIDYLHVDACICKQHSCCRLLQIKTHNCLQMGYIYNHNTKDLILFIFNISLIYIHINIHVPGYSF